MTFFGLSKVNWLHLTGEVDKSYKMFMPIFFRIYHTKNY